jgi:hypothetical protein
MEESRSHLLYSAAIDLNPHTAASPVTHDADTGQKVGLAAFAVVNLTAFPLKRRAEIRPLVKRRIKENEAS